MRQEKINYYFIISSQNRECKLTSTLVHSCRYLSPGSATCWYASQVSLCVSLGGYALTVASPLLLLSLDRRPKRRSREGTPAREEKRPAVEEEDGGLMETSRSRLLD